MCVLCLLISVCLLYQFKSDLVTAPISVFCPRWWWKWLGLLRWQCWHGCSWHSLGPISEVVGRSPSLILGPLLARQLHPAFLANVARFATAMADDSRTSGKWALNSITQLHRITMLFVVVTFALPIAPELLPGR